jgi:hypothetical protein
MLPVADSSQLALPKGFHVLPYQCSSALAVDGWLPSGLVLEDLQPWLRGLYRYAMRMLIL